MTLLSNIEYSEEIIDIIKNHKENQKCFDCNKNETSYASIYLGIFLCESCIKLHKKFDAKISKIKSLYIDTISKEEIQYLKTGGNLRLNLLISLYNIQKNKTNRIILYNSKLIEAHRHNLFSEVNNTNWCVMPEIEDALTLSDDINIESVKYLLNMDGNNTYLYLINQYLNGIYIKVSTLISEIKYIFYKFINNKILNKNNK